MLKIVRPVSFVLLSAAFCSGGVVHASDRAAITPRVGISQQEGCEERGCDPSILYRLSNSRIQI